MKPPDPLTTEVPLDVAVELLSAMGVIGGIGAAIKWIFFGGRGRARVDNAQLVADMATRAAQALIEPLTTQVTDLQRQLAICESRADSLDEHLRSVLGYAIWCHERLKNAPDSPPVPDLVLQGMR